MSISDVLLSAPRPVQEIASQPLSLPPEANIFKRTIERFAEIANGPQDEVSRRFKLVVTGRGRSISFFPHECGQMDAVAMDIHSCLLGNAVSGRTLILFKDLERVELQYLAQAAEAWPLRCRGLKLLPKVTYGETSEYLIVPDDVRLMWYTSQDGRRQSWFE